MVRRPVRDEENILQDQMISLNPYSIMNLAKVQPRRISKPDTKLHSKSVMVHDVSESLLLMKETRDASLRNRLAREIVKMCYGSRPNQLYLCNILGVPCSPGPVTLNSIPKNLITRAKQLPALFRYLQKVKQYFAAWIIFFDMELGILNLKLLTKFQFEQFNDGFDLEELLVGVFVGNTFLEKQRVKSTIVSANQGCKKLNLTMGLSTKTTNDSMHSRHQNKKIKSTSMKELKVGKSQNTSMVQLKNDKQRGKDEQSDCQIGKRIVRNPFLKKNRL